MNPFQPLHDSVAARRTEPARVGMLICVMTLCCYPMAATALPESATAAPAQNPASAQSEQHFFIKEYRVEGGGHLLPKVDVESAVYPYLGPYRTTDDVEKARGALEQVYRDKGFQTVTVQIPQQKVADGIVEFEVMQGEVGRLRVHGSRYFSIDQIKREAPSLQEGQSPNFTQVTHDLLVLNELPDRRVTPTLRAGETPGTVDVDLNVKDTPPIHGSLEINNRYSADTTPLRINGSVNYDNLWQLEHSIGFSFQVSPENPQDVKVFSAYYLARIPDVSWLSLMLQGTKQDSNVNTLGGIGVAGKGDVLGARAIISLPPQKDFYHSVSLGLDYKHFTQDESTPDNASDPFRETPITYFPLSAAYSGTWLAKGYETDLNASVNLAFRGTGSDPNDFQNSRIGASGDFIYFRGDLSHTRDFVQGFQLFVKAQGQASSQPLVPSEEFSGGGLGTVRGLLESEVLGDNALLGTIEMRSPSLGTFLGKAIDEWRFYVFSDGGILAVDTPLPETPYAYHLLSVGGGTRIKMFGHLNGSLDIGVPLVVDSLEAQVPAGTFVENPIRERPYNARLTFRVWADF